jgi:hypothetical protein
MTANLHNLTNTNESWLLAAFAIVYFYGPVELTGVKVRTSQELEMDKPIAAGAKDSVLRRN